MPKHRIMVVDDHPFYRAGLCWLLEQDARLRVVAQAGCGHDALHLADVHKPELVLMDVHLPGVTGLHVGAALRRQRPDTAFILLSMHVDDARLIAAMRAGAAGYLTKDAAPAAIVDAVHAVLRGENVLQQDVLGNPVLARRVFDEFRARSERRAAQEAGEGSESGEVDASDLSRRELEVLDCLVMGRSNKEIGTCLFITEQTVKNHMTSVLRKLVVDDRVAALRYAVTRGWVELGPQPYAAVERAVGEPGALTDPPG